MDVESVEVSLSKQTDFTATEDYESYFGGSKKFLQCSNWSQKVSAFQIAQFMA